MSTSNDSSALKEIGDIAPPEKKQKTTSTSSDVDSSSSAQIEAATPAEKKTVTLVSFDKKEFEVEKRIACQSKVVKELIDNCRDDNLVLLPSVTGSALERVLEYFKRLVEAEVNKANSGKKVDNDFVEFQAKFLEMNTRVMLDLIVDVDYLDHKGLLDLLLEKVASRIQYESVKNVRELLHIEDDFDSPEEEKAIRHKNMWAYK